MGVELRAAAVPLAVAVVPVEGQHALVELATFALAGIAVVQRVEILPAVGHVVVVIEFAHDSLVETLQNADHHVVLVNAVLAQQPIFVLGAVSIALHPLLVKASLVNGYPFHALLHHDDVILRALDKRGQLKNTVFVQAFQSNGSIMVEVPESLQKVVYKGSAKEQLAKTVVQQSLSILCLVLPGAPQVLRRVVSSVNLLSATLFPFLILVLDSRDQILGWVGELDFVVIHKDVRRVCVHIALSGELGTQVLVVGKSVAVE